MSSASESMLEDVMERQGEEVMEDGMEGERSGMSSC